jgi:acetolactate synthase-1/2/3 large subunit
MCTPRGKGIFPEDAAEFLGVTGLGGHASVVRQLLESPPDRLLVLGTRMGEFSSFWLPAFAPRHGFIHVDLDPDAFGAAYPDVPTFGIPSEIGAFLEALVPRLPMRDSAEPAACVPVSNILPRATGPVRPSYLMQAIQKQIVEQSDAIVLTEAGNSFALGSHHLRFRDAERYRVSTGFGSMGHAAAGVIGAALGGRQKAVAIVGDGSMLMLNELSTAVTYEVDAVWIVLNDARYGMIAQGMQAIGWQPFNTDFPRADFVAIARAMGCDGVRVECEAQLEDALRHAMLVSGPFLIDVIIDPSEPGPPNLRNASLVKQGVNGSPVERKAAQ